jgi:hypothetical protein
MHGLALDIFGEADLRGISIVTDHRAGNCLVRGHLAGFGQGLQGQQAPPSGDYGIFTAPFLTHDERLQQAERRDGSRQFVDAFVGIGLAHIALPRDQFVQGDADGISHDRSPRLVVRGADSTALLLNC